MSTRSMNATPVRPSFWFCRSATVLVMAPQVSVPLLHGAGVPPRSRAPLGVPTSTSRAIPAAVPMTAKVPPRRETFMCELSRMRNRYILNCM